MNPAKGAGAGAQPYAPRVNQMPRCYLVLPAAGSGRRMALSLPKQYLEVAGRSLLWHTLEGVGGLACFDRIVVALAAGDPHWPAVAAHLTPAIQQRLLLAEGGRERCASVNAALMALDAEATARDWVLVHDAVRPCVRRADVEKLIATLRDDAVGGLLATPLQDTLKQADDQQQVVRTVDRSQLWRAQTPQMFRYGVLRQALERQLASGAQPTDEAAAVEALGLPVRLVAGRADNIKVTWPEDLVLVSALLARGDASPLTEE